MRTRVFKNRYNGHLYLYLRCGGQELSFIQLQSTGAIHFTSCNALTPEQRDLAHELRRYLARPDITEHFDGAKGLYGVFMALTAAIRVHTNVDAGLRSALSLCARRVPELQD